MGLKPSSMSPGGSSCHFRLHSLSASTHPATRAPVEEGPNKQCSGSLTVNVFTSKAYIGLTIY